MTVKFHVAHCDRSTDRLLELVPLDDEGHQNGQITTLAADMTIVSCVGLGQSYLIREVKEPPRDR